MCIWSPTQRYLWEMNLCVCVKERGGMCVCVRECVREKEREEIRKKREIMLHVGIMLWVLILFESFNLLLVRRSQPNLFTKGQLLGQSKQGHWRLIRSNILCHLCSWQLHVIMLIAFFLNLKCFISSFRKLLTPNLKKFHWFYGARRLNKHVNVL